MKQTIDRVAFAELKGLHAEHCADLVDGAPKRRLLIVRIQAVPYSNGRSYFADIGVEPGPPGKFLVPSELGLRFIVAVDGSNASITQKPLRSELETAVRLLLATEKTAFAAAEKALAAEGIKPSKGYSSWSKALNCARLDPRLPRETLPGEPSWHFIFHPWDEATGYRGVLLDANSLRITSIQPAKLR